jgi:hypothetical protein
MNKNKKAQFKIQEMAFVLVAVIILFAFVMIFFSRFQLGLIQESATEIRREEAINMLHTIAAMPELKCSAGGEINCIDISKVQGFLKVRSNYYNIWKNAYLSKIEIQEFYPEGQVYILYSAPEEPEAGYVAYSTYIPLCKQEKYDLNCVIGKITVSSKSI